MKDECLQAVHDDDLLSLLKSLGVEKNILSGECVCNVCGKIITLENLGAIVPQDGNITFVCDDLNCINAIDIIQLAKSLKLIQFVAMF